jgi:hypothetical protein
MPPHPRQKVKENLWIKIILLGVAILTSDKVDFKLILIK